MMEQIAENNPALAEQSADAPAASLGKTLREARERLGLTVMEVSGQTKLAPRQIEALEADDYKHLPEMAFVRGFVRSYAKILKLDAQVLLAMLSLAKDAPGEQAAAPVEVPFPNAQRHNLIWIGAMLLVALLAVFFAVRSYTSPDSSDSMAHDKQTPVEIPVSLPEEEAIAPDAEGSKPDAIVPPVPAAAKAKSPEPVAQPAARATKPVVSVIRARTQPDAAAESGTAQADATLPGTLRLEFDEESWVEIKDRDGNILVAQVYQPGSELRLEGNAPLTLLVGHAPSVRLFYRDKQVNLAPHTRSSTQVAHLTLE